MSVSAAGEPGESTSSSRHAEQFFINVIWNWVGVGASFFAAFFLTRYIIHKLGEENYGIWALAFALIDYFWLFDLGLRSAVVNYISRFRATGETESINQVINTALCYFSAIAVIALVVSGGLSGQIYRLFRIQPSHRADFSTLMLLIGVSLSAGIFCCVFQAGLESFQCFKVYNHIAIAAMVLRVTGCWIVLVMGYGVVAMGCVVVFSQCSAYAMNFLAFRRAFPELRFSRSLIRGERLKEMTAYGIPSFFANSSILALNQGPTVLVGHFLPEAFVGYYSLPLRLLQYSVDMITRIGFVTAPNTAELVASGRLSYVAKLGMYLNRYCLALFLPFSAFLIIYGRDLISVWVGANFAAQSAPLLPAFVLATTVALAAQFNSSSILFGMAKHRRYARNLMIEAALMVAGFFVAVPRYGLLGGAWVAACLMIVNRGFFTPWTVCHFLKFSFFEYMRSIYLRPTLTLIPVVALGLWLKNSWLPG